MKELEILAFLKFKIWNLEFQNLEFRYRNNKKLFPATRFNLLSAAADKRISTTIGARGAVSRRR